MQISLVPTYGLTSPEAIVVTSIFGTPMGRDCITAEEMDAPMEPPKPIMPSNLPSRSISPARSIAASVTQPAALCLSTA